jgi:hypothetical protein
MSNNYNPNDSRINLNDAALFSALAYAPMNADSVTWGALQGGVSEQASLALLDSGWDDDTVSLMRTLNVNLRYFSSNGYNAFRVFVNSSTDQVVFAFKGSNYLDNFLSDIATSDQGYTQFNTIEAYAQALYTAMKASGSPYASYQFFSDGHSLGGGMAQTFALLNNISGFGQNSLPIAPLSATTYFTNFQSTFNTYNNNPAVTFQEVNLQGDIATALYRDNANAHDGAYSCANHCGILLRSLCFARVSVWPRVGDAKDVNCRPAAVQVRNRTAERARSGRTLPPAKPRANRRERPIRCGDAEVLQRPGIAAPPVVS